MTKPGPLDETLRRNAPAHPASGRARYDANLVRLAGLCVIIFALMTYLAGRPFLAAGNFQAILFSCPELGVLSLGIMLAMITGGIDLSAVGIANLSSLCAAALISPVRDAPADAQARTILFAVVLALAVAMLCGAVNGFLIAAAGIHPILATLGTMQLFTGIATVFTEGSAIHSYPEMFTRVGNGSIWLIPYPFVIFIAVLAGVAVFMKWRPTGRKIYLVGANPKAARFSAISTVRTLFSAYVVAGFMAGIAGLLIISRTNSAKADYGASYTMQAILVCLLAGVDPNGGRGRASGLLLAVVALQFLSSGFNQMRFSNFARDFTWGVFLVFVILFNYFMDRRDEKRRIAALAGK